MTGEFRFLVTGGTGSLGSSLVKRLATSNEVVVFSRSEERQFALLEQLGQTLKDNVKMFIGDLSDVESLCDAMAGCTHVIHAAAMKDLNMCQNQPWEAIKVNVVGTQNLLRAAQKTTTVRSICGISTDKAAKPSSTYGMTKYLMERLMISSTVHFPSSTKIFVARFGNMYDSSGSLVSHWKENPHKIQGLSHPDLTRYFFSKEDAARFVLSVVDSARHGEIHIPRMKSARIADIMAMLNVQATQRIHGLQRGEKIHEDLLGPEELAYTSLQEDRYIVHPDAIERSELDPSALSELSSSTS